MQEDIIIQIGNRLKEVRTEKKITLQELADKAGVTKGLISQIENSRTIPSLPVLLNIIRELQLDLNSFFDTIDFEKKTTSVTVKKKIILPGVRKRTCKGIFVSANIINQHRRWTC